MQDSRKTGFRNNRRPRRIPFRASKVPLLDSEFGLVLEFFVYPYLLGLLSPSLVAFSDILAILVDDKGNDFFKQLGL